MLQKFYLYELKARIIQKQELKRKKKRKKGTFKHR